MNKFCLSNFFPKVRCVISYLYYFFCSLILLTHGDVETNPSPKKSHLYFCCCHWNVNSLISHNILKVSLLEAYNTVHKYDFIGISETYFDSSVESDDIDLRINGYKLIRMDHPLNTKRGGVCIYYKESLVVKMINISYLQQLDNIRGYIALIYRSPSQNISEFQDFLSGFEQLLINIKGFKLTFTVLLGDYNTHSRSWWASNTNTPDSMQLDALTSSYGLQQLVNETTHTLPSSSSCIDLIFTDQPSIVVNSGTHPFPHANWHHQITYFELNLILLHTNS